MIQINKIRKIYRKGDEEFIALDDLDLTVKKGEFVVVSGASGAGKSTLLYATGGLVLPDSGEVLYYGTDIYRHDSRAADDFRKNKVGFMFQQFHLMPYLSVFENIQLACTRKEHFERIGYYLEKCNLSVMRKKLPEELSVGEKQRTAFIRAIISEPEILLADEPTGNLDSGNSEILMSLVKDYNLKGGTVVLVTHDEALAGVAETRYHLIRGQISQTVIGNQ
jgi:putative ABC transport system ATP-binding protein